MYPPQSSATSTSPTPATKPRPENTLTNPAPYTYNRIAVDHADHTAVSENTVTGGAPPGLSSYASSYASVSGNSFSKAGISFDTISPVWPAGSSSSFTSSNTPLTRVT